MDFIEAYRIGELAVALKSSKPANNEVRMLRNRMSYTQLVSWCAFSVILGPSALAADADNGKTLANRWCSSCHVVDREQKLATDQAPPFASLARMTAFDANKLAFLLLKPHPNMPPLSLSREEIADIAKYIATLK